MANVSSSNGLEKRPKLRFPGFDEPWKAIHLSDVGEASSGFGFPDAYQGEETSEIPFYKVSDMNLPKNIKVMQQANNYVSQSTVKKLRVRPFFEDAIVFAKVGAAISHERKRIALSPFLIDNNMMAFTPKQKEDLEFIYHLFQKIKLSKYSQVGALPSYNASDILDIRTFYPTSGNERKKIVTILSLVDNRIEKQSEIINNLKKYKRGVIQHIFRRSHGQTESQQWQQVRLGDIFKKVSRRNTDGKIKNVITNSAEYGLIPQRDFFDKDIAIEGNTENYYVIENGDFVYNPRKSITAPYGPFNRYTLKDQGIISPLYTCLVLKVNINPSYLAWYFKSDAWHRYIYDNGSQGVRHDRVSMTDDLLMGIPVIFPDRTTQDSIANALDLVENRLHLAQNKMDLLNMTRKGFMQQLFI